MTALKDIVGTIAQLLLTVAPRTPPPRPPWYPDATRSSAVSVAMRGRRADETHAAYVLAKQQTPPGQALCMVVYDDWFAVALFTSGDALSYRFLVRVDGSWMQRGGGGGGRGPERRLTAATVAGWSTPVRNPDAFASVNVHGTVGPEIARVQIEFDDGHTEDAVVGDSVYAWFYARKPPPRRPPSRDYYVPQLLGADPIAVIGLGVDGRELARQDLRHPL